MSNAVFDSAGLADYATPSSAAAGRPEIWAGLECTVRRASTRHASTRYFDQIERTGHGARAGDLERIAELGIRTLRYPVLWERTAPDLHTDWTWADERLGRLRELEIRPIAGLVHHGSGPRHTGLTDPAFPDKLAQYARAVAERYPWIEDFTPINEPLTTARFSGLYGLWYPHGRCERTFARAIVNQCRAVAAAMQAIRQITPHARLIQTEDLAKIHSTPALAYQAEFENQRRWLTFDLLCGQISPAQPMWRYLVQAGIEPSELAWFCEHPCPPDILGLNYYITSERFLDERLTQYPCRYRGGNGRHRYADIEAVRARPEGMAGLHALLGEVWERYQRPMAVTEVHLAGTREAQLRWFWEAWCAALRLGQEGCDVVAVTAWSLLGAFDWDSLLTRLAGNYESGVFDLRAPEPRRTALATMVADLAAGRPYRHPVLERGGWWHEPQRLLYGPARSAAEQPAAHAHGTPLLIAGTGTLGRAFARICSERGLEHRLLARAELDIADPLAVDAVLDEYRPWAVINAAGYVRVDEAEHDRMRCRQANTVGALLLATACAQRKLPLVTFSSDLVFDGRQQAPYVESDAVAPICYYGRTKAKAEDMVLAAHSDALVVRTSAFFGPWDEHNFVIVALRSLAAGRPFPAPDDILISPTFVPDLVNTCLDLMIDGERGLWHLANAGAMSWAELAHAAAERAGIDSRTLVRCSEHELGRAAARPRFSVLGSERSTLMPSLESALERFFGQCELEPACGRRGAVRPVGRARPAAAMATPAANEPLVRVSAGKVRR